MKTQIITIIALVFFSLNLITLASALNVDSDYITVYPGQEGSVKIKVENNLNYDLEDVSLKLNLENIAFTSVGSSEQKEDIDEDEEESFSFRIRANNDIAPGDYNIPYILKYEDDEGDKIVEDGTFGLRVSAKTELDFLIETQNNIIGSQGEVSLKIINKGLGEIGFVSVQVFPQNYELLSVDKVYIGTIDSDDSDSASFDVVFKSTNSILSAKIEYKDFDNNLQSQTVNIPLQVYTQEKALELGLIQKSNTGIYIGGVVILLVFWIIWRSWRKARKAKKRRELQNGN